MLSHTDRLHQFLSKFDHATVRTAYIQRVKEESGRIADTRQWMLDNGFELIDAPADRLLTDDGREILRAHGKSWALKPEVHAQRLAEALEAQKQRDAADVGADRRVRPNTVDPDQTTKSVAGTEALAEITCPKCGDAMQRSHVCPKCAAGKAGLKYRYTCPCGVEFVTKDKL